MNISDQRQLLDEVSERARELRRLVDLTCNGRAQEMKEHLTHVIGIADSEFDLLGDRQHVANSRELDTVPDDLPTESEIVDRSVMLGARVRRAV